MIDIDAIDTATIETPATPAKKVRRAAKKKAEKVSTAWNQGGTMVLHGCKVGGKLHRSLWAAWQANDMGYGRGRHIKFRSFLKKQLAAGGSPSAVHPRQKDGKKFTFTLVAGTPE